MPALPDFLSSECPSVSTALPYIRLQVASVISETDEAKSFSFEVPPELAQQFAYQSGQFLTLRVPYQDQFLPRCYSMSSAPGLDPRPRVTVKRIADGRGSNWLCDNLKKGDSIELLPPSGLFVSKDANRDKLLFAGGSGITPVYSIARSALQHGTGKVTLFYANRDWASVIFLEKLQQLSMDYMERLQVIHWLDQDKGFVNRSGLTRWIQEHAPQLTNPEVFICGPAPFMDAAEGAALDAGLPEDAVHVERFVSLPEEGAEQDHSAVAGAVDGAQVTIKLWGETYTVDVNENETILEAALRNKIPAPYSCQAGMCSTCMCKLEDGSAHMRHNEALSERDLARGMILSCQSVPTSAQVTVKFPD
jgi:3-ketosteroid 9alpha-monooxygenase subunit B